MSLKSLKTRYNSDFTLQSTINGITEDQQLIFPDVKLGGKSFQIFYKLIDCGYRNYFLILRNRIIKRDYYKNILKHML